MLLASSTLVAAGCDSDEQLDLPGLPALGEEEPDLERVRTGLRAEQAVLDQVARVRRRHRSLRRPLAPTLAVHRAHVQLLGRAVDGADEPAGGDGEDDGASTSPRGSRRVPRDPARAVSELIVLERRLAAGHVETAMQSRSGVLARMVATLSAAAAQQAVALAPLAAAAQESDR